MHRFLLLFLLIVSCPGQAIDPNATYVSILTGSPDLETGKPFVLPVAWLSKPAPLQAGILYYGGFGLETDIDTMKWDSKIVLLDKGPFTNPVPLYDKVLKAYNAHAVAVIIANDYWGPAAGGIVLLGKGFPLPTVNVDIEAGIILRTHTGQRIQIGPPVVSHRPPTRAYIQRR